MPILYTAKGTAKCRLTGHAKIVHNSETLVDLDLSTLPEHECTFDEGMFLDPLIDQAMITIRIDLPVSGLPVTLGHDGQNPKKEKDDG